MTVLRRTMKRFSRFVLPAALLILSGCGKSALPGQTQTPPRSVHVQTAERLPRAATEDAVGTIRPQLSATIEAKITGRIAQMLVAPGQRVTNGESLAQLDAHEIQARYDQASAARQQAQSDLVRFTALSNQQILSKSEFEAAQAKFRVADAAESEAKTLLSYTTISAPFDGVITRKLADVGDLATPGKILLQMENPASPRLETEVPEALVQNLNLGDQLIVRISVMATNIEGVVAEISPAADPNSRTFLVKLDLPNANGLRSGQFGRVAIPVGNIESIQIPASAVIQRGQMEIVFVAVQDRAQLRLVKTGRQMDGKIEIISGLNAGESIVIDDLADLEDGQPVVIKP